MPIQIQSSRYPFEMALKVGCFGRQSDNLIDSMLNLQALAFVAGLACSTL